MGYKLINNENIQLLIWTPRQNNFHSATSRLIFQLRPNQEGVILRPKTKPLPLLPLPGTCTFQAPSWRNPESKYPVLSSFLVSARASSNASFRRASSRRMSMRRESQSTDRAPLLVKHALPPVPHVEPVRNSLCVSLEGLLAASGTKMTSPTPDAKEVSA